ncbi:MAG: nuclear transport factor 2 family protein [Chitinophagaceae bacterium]|nr:nuclear transport factor 2 family protein [Chitinophagaceae bacterium]
MKKIFITTLAFCFSAVLYAQEKTAAEKLAQEQLDAYNNRDIEAFLKPYSDSVQVYFFPNQFLYKGKETMRKEYAGMFANTPDLHCNLKSRVVVGNRVIDEESVVFDKNKPAFHAVAIYTVANGKITAVHFIQ